MPDYMIWSHGRGEWWKPARWGYTDDVLAAGRYSEEEAQRICLEASVGWNGIGDPPEVMVPELSSEELWEIMRVRVQEATEKAVQARAKREAP
jgi:hypothetical protein